MTHLAIEEREVMEAAANLKVLEESGSHARPYGEARVRLRMKLFNVWHEACDRLETYYKANPEVSVDK